MARYSLNLPKQLKQTAEEWANRQGVSLNQFILWAVSEKVGALNQQLDDPHFPQITYRRGASGTPTPILRGTGIRVETIVVAHQDWGLPAEAIAAEYGIDTAHVEEALAFYEKHRPEVETLMAVTARMAQQANG